MVKRTEFLDIDKIKDNEIILVYPVSPDNVYQTNTYFGEFVKLVNSYTSNDQNKNDNLIIKELVILDTFYLRRHYSEESQKEWDIEWKTKNKEFLAKLKISPKFLSWKDIVFDEKYKEFYDKILSDYTADAGKKAQNNFKNTCDHIISEFSSKKGDVNACKKFLLEESAGFLVLPFILNQPKVYLTYPNGFNGAIKESARKYAKENICLINHKVFIAEASKTLENVNADELALFLKILSEAFKKLPQNSRLLLLTDLLNVLTKHLVFSSTQNEINFNNIHFETRTPDYPAARKSYSFCVVL